MELLKRSRVCRHETKHLSQESSHGELRKNKVVRHCHPQIVQRPLPHRVREGRHANVTMELLREVEQLEGWSAPFSTTSAKASACVADLVWAQVQLLYRAHMTYQTNLDIGKVHASFHEHVASH